MAKYRNQKVIPQKVAKKGITKILKELETRIDDINKKVGEVIGQMLSDNATKTDREKVLHRADTINKKSSDLLDEVHELDDLIRKLKRKWFDMIVRPLLQAWDKRMVSKDEDLIVETPKQPVIQKRWAVMR